MSTSEPDRLRLGKAIGRVPSGVYILTTMHGKRSHAMMASWVQQASFDPPALSIAIAKGRPIGDAIRANKQLAISILPEDDKTLMKHYIRGVPQEDDPFVGVNIKKTPAGLIVLSDALAWLQCRLISTFDFGADHE